jgi:hypothetical protein
MPTQSGDDPLERPSLSRVDTGEGSGYFSSNKFYFFGKKLLRVSPYLVSHSSL